MGKLGSNSYDMKKLNRSIMLQLIYKHPGIMRAELASRLGLSRTAITKQTLPLLESGIITEIGDDGEVKGKKTRGLTFVSNNLSILAVKVSRSRITFGKFTLGGELLESRVLSISRETHSDALVKQIKDEMKHEVDADNTISAVSLAVPGPFDKVNSRITTFTGIWDHKDVDLSPLLENDFTQPVLITHDSNCGAMYEWLNSEEYFNEDSTLAYMLVGEGVGAGIITRGQVIMGETGRAAEIGHISIDFNGPTCACGNNGCLELYSSSIAFLTSTKLNLQRYPASALNKYQELTCKDIFTEAEVGDELSLEQCQKIAIYMAHGVLNIINAYEPSKVIIGDEMSGAGNLILEPLLERLQHIMDPKQFQNIEIEMEEQGFDHILYGAASVAINHCLDNPSILMRRRQEHV